MVISFFSTYDENSQILVTKFDHIHYVDEGCFLDNKFLQKKPVESRKCMLDIICSLPKNAHYRRMCLKMF